MFSDKGVGGSRRNRGIKKGEGGNGGGRGGEEEEGLGETKTKKKGKGSSSSSSSSLRRTIGSTALWTNNLICCRKERSNFLLSLPLPPFFLSALFTTFLSLVRIRSNKTERTKRLSKRILVVRNFYRE